jgi:two-component system, chemotaxis family, chemotaxis protein CheY
MAYNVLIVDDSQTMRQVIRKTVMLSGFDVGEFWEAEDGQEALETLQEHFIDLILTDLNMPRMNGLDLLRHLAKDELYQKIPVVLVTIEGTEQAIAEARALGIREYVHKPFYPEIMRDVLNRIMEKTDV